ncbi:MAG: YbhB/YbcL family Raf kinase inhibitor-like protein, partial [Gammaproteobacteria bacterium]|nr:YbhB/YbcL family Raf kinase inhibitor-like protein [Gammaproteobacteria bacterium]
MKTIAQLLGSSALSLCILSGLLFSPVAAGADMADTITVASSAFEHHGTVPLANTAYGDNTAPQITWSNLPEGTVQLALVMDDPVAPTPEPFVHWVAYNIPADAAELPAGLTKEAAVSGVDGLEGMIN